MYMMGVNHEDMVGVNHGVLMTESHNCDEYGIMEL